MTWRTVGQRRVRAQFVDPVDGTEPQGPAAEGGSGWMAATTCAQPSWLDVDTDAQGMIDIAVHYQEWSVA